jgi:3-carboxy-cis,cis-muconate cycloisomerase
VHHGATSQDIVDTALVLRLRRIADLAEARADAVQDRLAALARAHRATLCVGRTRTQQAVPTSFGLRVVAWLRPLARERRRLRDLRGEVLALQLGGAAGNLSALRGDAPDLAAALAEQLDLTPVLPAWHAERDGVVAFGGSLARLAGAVGKLGLDVAQGCRSELGELRLAGAGGSSAMPHKTNPVAAETLVALARHASAGVAELHQAQLHADERDGAAWTGEWLALPQVAAAALAALGKAGALLEALEIDSARMAEHAAGGLQLPLAEAAGAALAAHLGKAEAERLVADACARAIEVQRPLLALLEEAAPAPVDWRAVADPAALMGRAPDLVDRALAEAEAAEVGAEA